MFKDNFKGTKKMKLNHEFITFPDNQIHSKFNVAEAFQYVPVKDRKVAIDCRITSSNELMNLLYFTDVLRHNRVKDINLNIWYLMAARMDRRISDDEPYSLKVVADILNSQNYNEVNVFFPHSKTSLDLINNSYEMMDVQVKFYQDAIDNFSGGDMISLVLPDEGAVKRFYQSFYQRLSGSFNVVECQKKREMSTGKLSGFKVVSGEVYANCLILDDLCDGGGTFVGLAQVLTSSGAKDIGLCVPHGIFSKGTKLVGIDEIYTTNSFKDWETVSTDNFNCWRIF